MKLSAINFSRGFWCAVWLVLGVSARGATVYTSEADFVSAINAFPIFLNMFTNFDYPGQLAHPITACETGICYEIYSQPPIHIVAFNGTVSTVKTNDQIVIHFNSGEVRAAGGYFFAAATNGTPASGSVSVGLSDGTTNTVATQPNNSPAFLGFVSTGPLFTNVVIQCPGGEARPAFSHFYAGIGIAPVQSALTSTNTLVLSWPAPGTGCVLEWCPNAYGMIWTDVAATPQQVGSMMQVVVPISGEQGYFRLEMR